MIRISTHLIFTICQNSSSIKLFARRGTDLVYLPQAARFSSTHLRKTTSSGLLPSGNLKWPFIVSFLIKNGDFP